MIPKYIRPFLWSYDIKKIDIEKHKKRIITNILNLGSKKATDWMFNQYNRQDIENVLINPLPGTWNKKSLNFWSVVFGVSPKYIKRKVK